MRLALDTGAYSHLHRGSPELVEAVRRADVVALPIIVVGELRFGFLHGSRLAANAATLDRFLGADRVEVLGIDDRTTQLFAEIATLLRRAGASIRQNDVWIAALCKQHDCVLATADRGFERVLGLRVLTV